MIICTSKENNEDKIMDQFLVELRELTSPPYTNIEGDIFGNKYFSVVLEANHRATEIARWIESAMTEKWERYFCEPLRWKEVANSSDWKCPDCKKEFYFNGHSPDELNYNYCPSCGKRLLSPEEKENA